ncbi:hypothetical protein TTHERM_00853040 (macronuclear) [Tetrahymena thermophila SB210]|uniref:Uncharacterized protein n=1 Tax=Tetrahymena thermophila (strain SB210) TaxID=312017 RepID=Q24E36_TETTS|nr:hypothetical protein TTHERM_00853040 [Tetrahymena thermophila SB210]EAS06065.1 hypothetical protein TTHERM_00853040 [Tetrahymena thermophila SB210]|eukprot:XP_001026310.1 hypothetical protein TTHERM_00853040 [Tetrahymena thermophila SB210]
MSQSSIEKSVYVSKTFSIQSQVGSITSESNASMEKSLQKSSIQSKISNEIYPTPLARAQPPCTDNLNTQNKKKSKWKRFLDLFVCCNKNDDALSQLKQAQAPSSNSAILKNFKGQFYGDQNSDIQSNNSDAKSNGSYLAFQFRTISNSTALKSLLYNVLTFPNKGYQQMNFGHFSFLQLPIWFEQCQYNSKKSFCDLFGACFSGDQILVVQNYLDWEFVSSIAKSYISVLCTFIQYFYNEPQIQQSSNQNIKESNHYSSTIQYNNNSSRLSSSSSNNSNYNINFSNKFSDQIFEKQELQNTEFLNCQNLSSTLNLNLFDKIIIIPTSLKHQVNSFDQSYSMKKEFRVLFSKIFMEYIEQLHKVIFILPKYCKIKEVVQTIYDCYSQSTLQIQELNFGLQFYSFQNELAEVEYIVLQFNQDQHHQTLATITYKIFSNVHQVNSFKKTESSDPKLNKEKNEQIKASNQVVRRSDIKQKIKLEKLENKFFDAKYISQIGQASLKNIQAFLKEINQQFIIQNNAFQYRTHIIDTMLKNNIIQQSFVLTLVKNLQKRDEIKQSNSELFIQSIIRDSNSKKKSDSKQNSNKKQSSSNQQKLAAEFNSSFKKYFLKYSQQYIYNEESSEKIAKYQSATDDCQNSTADHVQNQNTHENHHQTHNSFSRNNNAQSNPTEIISQIEEETNNQDEVLRNSRGKNSSKNRQSKQSDKLSKTEDLQKKSQIGKNKKQLSKSIINEDIFNYTTANKVQDQIKILKELKSVQATESKYCLKQSHIKYIQEVIPEEMINQSKALKNSKLSSS